MPQPHASQLRALFDAVYEMNTARDHADFASAILAAMSRLIPADTCHIHIVDRTRGRILQHAFPAVLFSPEEIAYYVAHPQENALVSHTSAPATSRPAGSATS